MNAVSEHLNPKLDSPVAAHCRLAACDGALQLVTHDLKIVLSLALLR